jgi:colanic acid/amylovoran biosynthesis glycosyltransferase
MSKKNGLKIAFITENFPVLSETFVLFKAVALQERGHEVWVFTQKIRREKIMHEQIQRFDVRHRIIKLPSPERVRLKDLFRGLAYGLFRVPHRVIALAFRIGLDPRARGQRLLRFNLAVPFLRRRFDIINAQFGNCGAHYFSVQDSLGIPMVVHFQGSDIHLPRRHLLPAYQKMFASLPRFLPNSRYLYKEAEAMGCPAEKMKVIFNEKDLNLYSYFDRRGRSRVRSVILTVARLHWVKGYIYALEAIRILKQKGLDFEYWIVGEGNARQEIELAVKDFDIADRVKLLGAKTGHEVRNIMYEADIFLLTSVLEGLPAIVAEAHGTGLPVVITRVGGVPECMVDGETGFLVDSRDSQGITDRLQYLIEHPEVRWQIGEKGRRFVEENFEQGKLIGRLIETYQEVIRDWQKKPAS